MLQSLCLCWALVGVALDDPPAQGAPAGVPDLPGFRAPGAQIKSGEQLFGGPRGRNLWVDLRPQGRRVLVRGTICLREGQLEEFLCKARTKEHESIVAADVEPRYLHTALLLAGAESGSVARFEPEFQPPTGDEISVSVEWREDGKPRRAKAQEWIRDARTGKAIAHPWVFAGSQEIENPITKQKYYLANDGDLISVANFASSLIDIAVRSDNADADRLFEAFTDRIPPRDTEVFVILEPVPRKRSAEPAPRAGAEPAGRAAAPPPGSAR